MRVFPALLTSVLTGFALFMADAAYPQTFRRAYLGAGYSLGVAQEPLSIGLRAKGRGALLEGGYHQSLKSRWLFTGDLFYQTLNGHMEGFSDLEYYDEKASNEQRFGLSYDELVTKALGLQTVAGYHLRNDQANWRPWLGLGLGFTGTSMLYLHPITNTRVYVTHLRPALVSSAGLMGIAGSWYFDARLDAMPASLLAKRVKTNSLSEKAIEPDLIGPAAARFEAAVSARLGQNLLVGLTAAGQHRYAGDENGGYLSLSFGLRLGYQVGSWGLPRIRSPKVEKRDKDNDSVEDKEGEETEQTD